jgi:DNA (cytosine-5)-methyltransferase 1
MFELINEWRPNTVFGEQVASKDALGWLDIVSTDLEGAAYAVGAVDTCAAGFGAPHIRQRLYWVANSTDARRTEARQHNGGSPSLSRFTECGRDGQLANANGGKSSNGDVQRSGQYGQQQEDGSVIGGMEQSEGISGQDGASETERQRGSSSASYWSDCDWLPCIDGKARPVEPGTFPLVNGAANRVGRLRGYGNAIVAPQAQAFIEAFMEID